MIDVAVVGAGWSGLTAAARLAASGYSVVVVEKSRGAGGRSATRREDGFAFDHGAQYLTARSEAFSRQVEQWASAGLLQAWRPRIRVFGERPKEAGGSTPAERWVGVPGMNSVPRRLAEGLDCRWRWRLVSAQRSKDRWQLEAESGETLQARSLLLTAPPAQARDLLGPEHPLSPSLAAVGMQPCWALMLGFERAPAVDFDAAFVNQGCLDWLARNDSKPRRSGPPSWTVHAGTDWSRRHLEDEPSEVARELEQALARLEPAFAQAGPVKPRAHRWRYARSSGPLEAPVLGRDDERLVVAGDWCAGERIEGAWISGVAAARRLQSLF